MKRPDVVPACSHRYRLTKEQTATLLSELQDLLGSRVQVSKAVLETHGRGESWQAGAAPDAVLFPSTTEEVSAIVNCCAKRGAPVIAFGAGTSVEGHVAAVEGGICVDLSQMQEILRVSPEDGDCTVQAGVTRKLLNEHLRDMGLFFPIDPGADASIGGMAATRASGTNAVRYGTMRDNVLALRVVLPNGEVITTGGRARKSSAGYDLTRLFIGSEGTLGIITEVTLKLHPQPETITSAVCSFATLEGAVNTVISTIQFGVPVARVELLDEVQMAAINRYSKLSLDESPTLFLEFHGSAQSVEEQTKLVGELAGGNGGGDFRWATLAEERSSLWQARHDAYYAAMALRPGCKGWPTDVCVPISSLADCIFETKEDLSRHGVTAPILGHVGDGNFHVILTVNPDDSAELELASSISQRLVERALRFGGTCTGEHGIGLGKREYLVKEHGSAVATMRAIKMALDPQNIMNPGKIFL